MEWLADGTDERNQRLIGSDSNTDLEVRWRGEIEVPFFLDAVEGAGAKTRRNLEDGENPQASSKTGEELAAGRRTRAFGTGRPERFLVSAHCSAPAIFRPARAVIAGPATTCEFGVLQTTHKRSHARRSIASASVNYFPETCAVSVSPLFVDFSRLQDSFLSDEDGASPDAREMARVDRRGRGLPRLAEWARTAKQVRRRGKRPQTKFGSRKEFLRTCADIRHTCHRQRQK